MLSHHRHENKVRTAKNYDSEPVFYQTKSTAREMQQWNREKSSFKQVQTAKMLTLNNVIDVNVEWVFYIPNPRDTLLIRMGFKQFHKALFLTAINHNHWTIPY